MWLLKIGIFEKDGPFGCWVDGNASIIFIFKFFKQCSQTSDARTFLHSFFIGRCLRGNVGSHCIYARIPAALARLQIILFESKMADAFFGVDSGRSAFFVEIFLDARHC